MKENAVNNTYITRKYFPLLGQSIFAVMIVYFVSSYFDWPLDWFITFYLILLVYYFQKTYKLQYKRTRDIILVIVSALFTLPVAFVYWMLYHTHNVEEIVFQLLSVGLYVIIFSLLWLPPYFLGSDFLKEQLEKKIK
jgi:hypothetical protein